MITKRVRYALRGFSLLEMMVSVAIGSALLLLMVRFFTQTLNTQQASHKRLQLQSEIHRVLNLMAKDIARSGYIAQEQVRVSNAALFSRDATSSGVITQAQRASENSCFLFWYDVDQSGCIGSRHDSICAQGGRNRTLDIQTELLGYRLNSQMVETRIMYKRGTQQQCRASECQAYLADSGCDTKGWGDLMDSATYQITALNFTWLVVNKALRVDIAGRYKAKRWRHIHYQSAVVIPIENQLK
ncbi:prepilin-type N-terminal cleavage/methylation domain-containing protein [Pasteurellaceae bacterium HPA106]|uniref:prepilin-type N-terminal cleavage/methylation domain-containing protein n=1 Tax=Spirabiliibacterium pneumoniae TaxID=221400 RepID=UPI001AACB7FA|nr:prepilin-type N-terminal cleavage/methylation domain-containing protein [Spirabiliibacterium pneumoniae]MBE2896301.1 prepilin-type N-terminal cleavage/methylation domain-containing protein [Spirabiliibacterium pneumoniae]